jgi:hypothetical protein
MTSHGRDAEHGLLRLALVRSETTSDEPTLPERTDVWINPFDQPPLAHPRLIRRSALYPRRLPRRLPEPPIPAIDRLPTVPRSPLPRPFRIKRSF